MNKQTKRNISDCVAVAHMHVDIKSHSGASAFSVPYVCKLSKKGEERRCFNKMKVIILGYII